MKRISIFTMCIIAALCTPILAQAAEDLIYTLNSTNDGVVITGYRGTGTRVIIPAVIEDFPVKEIAPYAFSAGNLELSRIPIQQVQAENNQAVPINRRGILDTAVYTVNMALSGNRLVEVNVEYKITSVVIPEGITKIGDYAFAQTSFRWDIWDHPFSNRWDERDGEWNPPIPFNITSSLTSISIPSTVTEIGEHAFSGCGIESVIIPEGITALPAGLFSDCTALTTVTLPQSLTSVEEWVFSGCASLNSITIPDNVTSIGFGVFSGSGLVSFNWPAHIPVIPSGSFSGSNLRTIVIPEGVSEIGWGAFQDCAELTSVTLPSTIRNIGGDAFSGNSALTIITIPNTITTLNIASSAFEGCSRLGLASQARLNQLGYTGRYQ
ncbi:MAG: leucine-rich repeat domain-containing protein [Treponema sp.]|nr:leucine-rich repeat domain-containing protein [Treponema sp.]